MRLTPGTRFGAYQVTALIGAGGMGEVYRAEDARLGRSVALKILPAAVASDAERLVRFEREARALAALNHPHISAIYGVEDADEVRALVLELVEGPTLADRLQQGTLPIDEAIALARQIADALVTAHDKGIIHRDLKPANIKLTADGAAKVLDFGLAKAIEASGAAANGPTVTTVGTRVGVVLGTPAYMSPEQARGLPVDRRTDIWAFGCVLYEMLTGRAAFAGETVSDTLARVLERDPEWTQLPQTVPAAVRRLLRRCLEKDPKRRLRDIGDARLELDDAAEPSVEPSGAPTRAREAGIWMAVTLLTAFAAGLAGWLLKPSDTRVSRLSLVPAAGESFGDVFQPLIAIAPDGRSIVYAAEGHLSLRSLDEHEPKPIRGSEGSPGAPFFSPDGQSIGYWDRARGQLRRIPAAGGTAIALTPITSLYGAVWVRGDSILYAQEDGIWRISADGGTPEQLVGVDESELAYGPQLLADANAVLFSLVKRGSMVGQSTAWDTAHVVVQSLETGERQQIVQGGAARLLPTGHLVYALGTTLFAVAFDLSARQVRGGPVPIVEGVQRSVRGSGGQGGAANFDVSGRGTLVYVPSFSPAGGQPRRLLAVDSTGKDERLIEDERDYWRPLISPDGRKVAVEVLARDPGVQVWIVDLERGTSSPLAAEGESAYVVWADEETVIYRSARGGNYGVYRQAADGASAAELLFESPIDFALSDVTPEGALIFQIGNPQTDIRMYRPEDRKSSDLVATPAREHMASVSPDGKWLAYTSNRSGQDEVYVQAFPRTTGVERLVSVGGGTGAVWSPDGSTLYYRGSSGHIMAVPTTVGARFAAERPRPLFRFDGVYRMSGTARAYDIHPDGKRFIMVSAPEPELAAQSHQRVNIVLNWFEELRRLVPLE